MSVLFAALRRAERAANCEHSAINRPLTIEADEMLSA